MPFIYKIITHYSMLVHSAYLGVDFKVVYGM